MWRYVYWQAVLIAVQVALILLWPSPIGATGLGVSLVCFILTIALVLT